MRSGVFTYVYVGNNGQGTTGVARHIANVLRKLPPLDAKAFDSWNRAPGPTEINSAIDDINSQFGTNFGPLNDTIIQVVETFVRIVGPYDQLMVA